MKYYLTLLSLVFFISSSAFSQEKVVKYKVSSGETINQIAQKFKVTPYDIYKLNPDARTGLSPNTVLLIPTTGEAKKEVSETKTAATSGKEIIHEVQPKETFYSIEKKYGISDEALKAANPFLEKTGVQIGQKLVIPAKGSAPKTAAKPAKEKGAEKYVYHDVQPKETKFGIAKQYNMTVDELEKRNPDIVSSLPVGYRLTIKGTAPKAEHVAAETAKPAENKKPAESSKKAVTYMDYQVKPKETFYSLGRVFHLSQDELVALNPSLSEGVKEGMVLKVPAGYIAPAPIIAAQVPSEKPADSSVNKPVESTGGGIKIVDKVKSTENENVEIVELTKKRGVNERKKVVLLLPFNMAKVQSDTSGTANRIKNDKFLNMTLDFYSGALMAIDSAKTLKLPIDVAIYDSQETKTTSSIVSLVPKLQDADAVIGPFYQNNAEVAANMLSSSNVPVISPLSKDSANPIDNLYQTVPANDVIRNAVFDFIRSKNGNIIAVVDKKKESVINYIKQNQKGVAFASLTETGGLDVANLKSLLLPNRMNYVVMETGNTAMVKATIKALLDSQKTCQVQLVILEPNSTLDTDEISFDNLVKLKLMYPSVTRESDEQPVLIYEKQYRLKNKANPTTYATRGFDVTFDTMMRLMQGKTFQETADLMTTQQVDNKFQYYRKEDGGHANKGVYILYYDTDLTLKVAN
ncbi:PBP1 and LysM peptidoglycan-binding domain-containing protein [Flavobacterium nitrogenifigens]|uniref:Amino acid/amide ABC transporter substrate-binding protein, HAAT family n=1 Tax=Flavobacterium nitrogenifigens TaxID=1617283 RepID=A0A521AQG8_9FLAO|nr:LysM peptidoglycan-binding domain-containing protein [Flavobacterium nitrogenifigens]KAF2329337.1 LysM peptidoglycan-binding domain-containing protein [Flavobacterium nitrogenifigens]SMO37016.1 amino acid/amide ABC transporter substrate-binding protein, HAAT family [Flavobacterium nitrogenifigens]